MASNGLAAIFMYVLPAIVFLVPVALVAAELASGWNGGVVVWFPAQLAFFAGAMAYVFQPSLAANGLFVGSTILIVYWIATMISLRGMGYPAFVGSKGLVIGSGASSHARRDGDHLPC